MKILALESSAKAASVALWEDGRLISEFKQSSALTHSRTLLRMAENLLGALELTVRDLSAVAVAVGPGSFTGVRIGVAAAKGLCWGGDLPAIGVSTLEAMAYHGTPFCGAGPEAVICPVMDARRGQVYNAKFRWDGGKLVRLTEDRAVELDILVTEAKNEGKPYFFVGDGTALCYNRFIEESLPALLPPEPLVMQSAWGVAMAARGKEPGPAWDLTPNYLRLSQAERERLERDKQRSGV